MAEREHCLRRIVGAVKCEKRQVRRLAGGVLTFGNTLMQIGDGDRGSECRLRYRWTDPENVGFS